MARFGHVRTPTPTSHLGERGPPSQWLGIARRLGRLRLGRAALLGVALGVVASGALEPLIETRLVALLLTQATARAVDHAQLVVLQQVSTEELMPPFEPDRLARLNTLLAPLLDRAREPGSGIIRVNVFAPDGTLLASDDPSLPGKWFATADARLAAALQGHLAAERSALDGAENGNLKGRFAEALEVYVPLTRDGRVIGAYAVYLDLASIQALRPVVWLLLATTLSSLGYIAIVKLRPPAPPPEERRRRRAKVSGSDASLSAGQPLDGRPELSPRELEVLRLLAASHTYREIASALMIGEETVRTHVKSILRKLDQPDRTQAIVAAVRSGLLRLPERP